MAEFAAAVRERVYAYMNAMGVPVKREAEAYVSWPISGDAASGVVASFSDADDVIEFGVLDRRGDEAVNTLHASLVIDEDQAQIHSVSAAKDDMNFVGLVGSDNKADGLFLACDYFGELLKAQQG